MPRKPKKTTVKNVQSHEASPYIPPLDIKPEIETEDNGDDGLTIRQRLFVKAITGPALGNATKAAEMAGYKSDNRITLKATASEILTKPYIQQAIAHALTEKCAGPEWAKRQLIDLARSDMANFVTVDANGESKLDFKKASELGALPQIKEYQEEVIQVGSGDIKTIKRKIKVHDRLHALGILLKLHGLIRDTQIDIGSLLTTDAALASAEIPPGAIPSVAPPSEIQNDSRGPEKRED